MIQTIQILPQVLTTNTDDINFSTIDVRSRSANCCGWLQYMPGGSNFVIIGGGRFKISFNANVTSDTAGTLALALKSSLGSDVEGTEMDTVIDAAGDYQNISFNKILEVCPRVNVALAIGSLAAIGGVTPTVETEIPTIKDANLIIEKIG
jgi:hypothetical protein